MTKMTQNIAALVGSRICHDLISPLGAIGNGMELLSLSGLPETPEMALINESIDNANARIRFFRVAFGFAGHGQLMPWAEIQSILSAISVGSRTSFDWQVDGNVARNEVRPVFLAIMCLEAALPFGGRIDVAQTGTQWVISGRGERLNIDQELWNSLSDDEQQVDPSPAQVQFAILPAVVVDLGRNLTTEIGDQALHIRF